jgi:hypothetical protein
MTETFRLLRSSGGFEPRSLGSGYITRQCTIPDVEFSQRPDCLGSRLWVSVVIGKNGVGKSRLPAGIANIFENIDRGKGRRWNDRPAVSKIAYVCDGRVCEIEADDNYHLRGQVDGRQCELAELPLPTKIIALTTTPFDKFRISRSLRLVAGREEADVAERYRVGA